MLAVYALKLGYGKKKPGFCGKTNLGFVGKPEFREKLGGFCGEKNLGFGKKKLVLKNKT